MTDRDLLKLCAELLPKYKDAAWEDEPDNIRCDVGFLRRKIDRHLKESDTKRKSGMSPEEARYFVMTQCQSGMSQ